MGYKGKNYYSLISTFRIIQHLLEKQLMNY